jgi:hypothetical protein
MRLYARWTWGFALSLLVASTAGWGAVPRPSRTASMTASKGSPGAWTAWADIGFSTRSKPETVGAGPEEDSVPVPLKGGCGTEVLVSAFRPPLRPPAFIQVVSDGSVEALDRAWDAYYGDAWRRLYTHMDVHPRVGSVSSEYRLPLSRPYWRPFWRTPVPPRFRGQVPYYYYRYGYPYGYFFRYRPFFYYRRFFVVPFFRVYPFYFFYDPFFYPFYPLYRFYFFYGYPYWGYPYGWDDGYRRRPVPPEERRVRGAWGELWFDVQPEDAWIYVDDQLWGRAGDLNGWWKSRRVRSGEHRIRIEHEKYPPRELSVRVPPDEAVSVRVDLRRADERPTSGFTGSDRQARLRVQVNVVQPEFLVDGQPLPARYDESRQVWVLDIPYGTHTLEVRAEGYDPAVQPIRITSAEADLWVELTPRAP